MTDSGRGDDPQTAFGPVTSLDSPDPGTPQTTPVGARFEIRGHRFQIGEELGRGGMGRVIAATDVSLRRTVAIKQALHDDVEFLLRFEREVRITARLEHPAIVPIYDTGTDAEGRPYYVMRRIQGDVLADRVRAATDVRARLALVPQLLTAIEAAAFAHARGIIHRDIKPTNVLLGAYGETLLIDWGLARELDDETKDPVAPPTADERDRQLTRVGLAYGTPGYMSPEQARAEIVDERADVYALGATLFYVLVGRGPFSDLALSELDERVVTGLRAPVELIDREVPRELVAIVAKAMAFRKSQRYRDAGELAADLRSFLAGQLVSAHRYTPRERFARFVRRHRVAVAIAALAAVAITTVSVIAVQRILRERASAEHSAAISQQRLVELYLEQGRIASIADDPMRALVYLQLAAESNPRVSFLGFLVRWNAHRLDGRIAQLRLPRRVDTFAILRDGQLVTGTEDRIQQWDLATGREVRTIDAQRGAAALHVSKDSRRLASIDRDGARLWNLDDGSLVAAIPHDAEYTVSGNEHVVVTADRAGTVRLWDSRTGEPRSVLTGHRARIRVTAMMDNRLATCDSSGVLMLWNVANPDASIRIEAHRGDCRRIAFDTDGLRIASAGFDDRYVRVWDAVTGRRLVELPHPAEPRAVAFHRKRDQLFTAAEDRAIRVWEIASARELRTMHTSSPSIALAIDQSGERVATGHHDGSVRLWHAESGALVWSFFGHSDVVWLTSFDDKGAHIVTAGHDQTVAIWNARPETRIALEGHAGNVWTGVFSRDGKLVATTAVDGKARIWSADGKLVRMVSAVMPEFGTATFSPDGKRLAIGGADGAGVFDVASGRELVRLRDLIAVTFIVFDRTGEQVITATQHGGVRISSSATGAVLRQLRQTGKEIWQVAISPDNKWIASGGFDGVHIWNLATGELRTLEQKWHGPVTFSVDGNSSLPAAPTLVSESGTSLPARYSPCSKVTRAPSAASTSARMAAYCSRRATMAACGCGVSRAGASSRSSARAPKAISRRTSVLTANRS